MVLNKSILLMWLAMLICLLYGCSELEFNNPLDEKANSYVAPSSSSGEGVSASSSSEGEQLSSSGEQSAGSSCEGECSSSSGDELSSGEEQSSSSEEGVSVSSSSEVEQPSSSSSEEIKVSSSSSSVTPLPSCSSSVPNTSSSTKCGDEDLTEGYFCYENTDGTARLVAFCGNNRQEFNPNEYSCKSEINANGIYLKSSASNYYEAVLIGEQTWMTKNLNVKPSGDNVATDSWCYGGEDGEDGEGNCKNENNYGRYYNWATAMALPDSCNSGSCADQIGTPHKGICPTGWHIPSDDDWSKLNNYVGFAKFLRAKSGWSDCDSTGTKTYECLDTYGFSALPAGSKEEPVANYLKTGKWWSLTEYTTSVVAYVWSMANSSEWINLSYSNKLNNHFSVRCVRN